MAASQTVAGGGVGHRDAEERCGKRKKTEVEHDVT